MTIQRLSAHKTVVSTLFTKLDRVAELMELYPADEPGRKTFINKAIR